MALFSSTASIYAIVTFIGISLWQLSQIGRRPKDYPPGPPTLPLLGNLHLIPDKKRHLQFEKWAREYGPIFSLMLGTKAMIVLSSDQAIKDLVDKRGAIYSSRPDAYIAQDILSGGLRVLFMPNSPTGAWKMVRKFLHTLLSVNSARTYVPYQDLENKAMLLSMLENPNSFIEHLRRYTASLTTQMTFGFRTTSIEDPRFKQAFDTAAMLDLLPILRNLPDFLLPIKREGRKIHMNERNLFRSYFLSIKKATLEGTAKAKEGFKDDLAAYISGSVLQAGSETTASILVGFVQAMVIWPEVARAAQEELDRVCGDRLPDLNDLPDLPYIRACAKESLRWMPGFFLGIPHAVTKEDTYLGYRIPKGAIVILNVWGVHMDPERHPDPRKFDPMRYLGDDQSSMDAANNPDASKRDHFVFGAGRRRCQGMHIADRSMYLAISRLLWAFDFKRVIDPSTQEEIVPDMENLADGMMSLPHPFPANIVPRSEHKAQRVRDEWREVSILLDGEAQWKDVPKGLIWNDEKAQTDDF
ncbi:hypothetical protein N0V90_000433 [Kalmusia sp. IMI 367209]|nr:hypothetical protein N0V90_000433 [Kalmusia sp. IMI 367209]